MIERSPARALTRLVPGVRAVDVDIATKKVTVEYDGAQADVERFKAALAEEDYPVAAAEPVGTAP